jgi:hypothetical protein
MPPSRLGYCPEILIKVKLLKEVTLPPARINSIEQQTLAGAQCIEHYSFPFGKLTRFKFV